MVKKTIKIFILSYLTIWMQLCSYIHGTLPNDSAHSTAFTASYMHILCLNTVPNMYIQLTAVYQCTLFVHRTDLAQPTMHCTSATHGYMKSTHEGWPN